MPFGEDATDNHYLAIEEVCDEISNDFSLEPALHPERVDWFNDGTSYDISDKIFDMISDSGLLIGDLTHANVNVYNEIGFVMSKAKAEGLDTAHMLLILDESVGEGEASVGFNLQSIKQIRFTQIAKLKEELRKNIKHFYNL